jgi:RNA recognition motif-containing protein
VLSLPPLSPSPGPTPQPPAPGPIPPQSFGKVEEVNIFKERRTHVSKGCGFVLMAAREAARAAIEALDEQHAMVGPHERRGRGWGPALSWWAPEGVRN